jgi:pimeloyl-ACP methyl ester carboxylesterase
MTPAELRAMGKLGGRAFAGLVSRIEQVHQVIAGRAFAPVGLAVFVHGLAETENSWHRRAGQSIPYGHHLQAEFGYTPVYVRYNTARHISDSGHDLADLLDGLAAAWPERADEILLAGHSMGGL